MNLSVFIKVDNSIFYGPDVQSRNHLEYIQRVTLRQFSRLNIVHLIPLPNPDEVDVRKKYQFNVCSVYKFHSFIELWGFFIYLA